MVSALLAGGECLIDELQVPYRRVTSALLASDPLSLCLSCLILVKGFIRRKVKGDKVLEEEWSVSPIWMERGMGWDGMGWDGMGWDGMGWDGMGWVGWDGMGWDGWGCAVCRVSQYLARFLFRSF